LQQPRKNAAVLDGHLLHDERSADAPLGTHPDSEQSTKNAERDVVRGQSRQHLDDRKEHQIEHQRQPAPVAVGDKAEAERADRPVAPVSIGVVTCASGSRSCAARMIARNRSVSIGLSSGAFGGYIVSQWTAVSPTTRTSSARTAAVSWSGSRRMSISADASEG